MKNGSRLKNVYRFSSYAQQNTIYVTNTLSYSFLWTFSIILFLIKYYALEDVYSQSLFL